MNVNSRFHLMAFIFLVLANCGPFHPGPETKRIPSCVNSCPILKDSTESYDSATYKDTTVIVRNIKRIAICVDSNGNPHEHGCGLFACGNRDCDKGETYSREIAETTYTTTTDRKFVKNVTAYRPKTYQKGTCNNLEDCENANSGDHYVNLKPSTNCPGSKRCSKGDQTSKLAPGYEQYDGCFCEDLSKDAICENGDSDCDGLPDTKDSCDNDREDFDGFADGDGCPDPDNDGDSICDKWVNNDSLRNLYKGVCHKCDLCPDEECEGQFCIDTTSKFYGCPSDFVPVPISVFENSNIKVVPGAKTTQDSVYARFLSFSSIPSGLSENYRKIALTFYTNNKQADSIARYRWSVSDPDMPSQNPDGTPIGEIKARDTFWVNANVSSATPRGRKIRFNVVVTLSNPADVIGAGKTWSDTVSIEQSSADSCVQAAIDAGQPASYYNCLNNNSVTNIELVSASIISDHGLMIDNSSDFGSSGQKFSKPDWKTGMAHANPVSHTAGIKTKIEIELNVITLNSNPISQEWRISGLALLKGLNYDTTLILTNGKNKFSINSMDTLDTLINLYSDSIAWIFERDSQSFETQSGPHKIYCTAGIPVNSSNEENKVTEARMFRAIQYGWMAHTRDMDKIADTILTVMGPYSMNSLKNAWEAAGRFDGTPTNPDCQTIIRFLKNVCLMLGLKGSIVHKNIYAVPSNPSKAILGIPDPGSPTEESIEHPERKNDSGWVAYLIDSDTVVNVYEAVAIIDAGHGTKYYPGGISCQFSQPDDVLCSFWMMAYLQIINREPFQSVIKEKIHGYWDAGTTCPGTCR